MELRLENLPRTVMLVRAGDPFSQDFDAIVRNSLSEYILSSHVPPGIPIFAMLDQTMLPRAELYLCTADWRVVIDSIKKLVVRGAPAIGIAGAAAVALRAAEFCYAQADKHREDTGDFERVFVIDDSAFDPEMYRAAMEYAARMIVGARPTAVNLGWAVNSAMEVMRQGLEARKDPKDIANDLFDFVCNLIEEDERTNRAIGKNGAALISDGSTVLTHCNAGSLATAFYGTALGVIYSAAIEGKIKKVYADETRPVCQGSRLTAWELSKVGIPVTVICDDMAASVMSRERVDAVIVGADRIAANGDVANKIGTLGVAILAKHFGIPFYVAAPSSTVDQNTHAGGDIVIEKRDASEVMTESIDGVDVFNPAFDVTPACLITKIITEKGVFSPYEICESF